MEITIDKECSSISDVSVSRERGRWIEPTHGGGRKKTTMDMSEKVLYLLNVVCTVHIMSCLCLYYVFTLGRYAWKQCDVLWHGKHFQNCSM